MPAPTRVRKRNPRYQDEDDEEEENPRQRSRSLAFGMSDSNIRDDPDEQQNNINNYNDDDASHTAVQDQSNDREEFHVRTLLCILALMAAASKNRGPVLALEKNRQDDDIGARSVPCAMSGMKWTRSC